MRKFLFLCLLFMAPKLESQTLEKWSSLVNWDGASSWKKYIIYSPLYMGPNALPVPSMNNGSIDSLNTFTIAGAINLSKGDFTQNVRLSVNYCLVKDVISFDLSWIPVEWYQMSSQLKNNRHVFYEFYNAKKAKGDMYLNTNLQLFNRWREFVHLSLRIGYRFPTSSGLGSARYTDAPGYHFDVSAARFLSANKKWKLTSMLGFYVWQTNSFGQNDAFMFGAGIEYNSKNWRFQLNNTGYLGWIGNGDDPVIMNMALERKCKHLSVNLGVRHGLNDYSYSGIEVGTKIRLSNLKE